MRLLPPLLWLMALALIGLSHGVGWGPSLLPPPVHWAGALLFTIGAALTIAAAGQFRNARTNINTFRDPGTLVTTGLFAISRNPMYLGFLLSALGAAILANRAIALVPVAAFFLTTQFHYIPFEERAAERVFGSSWRDYSQRVRRWL